MMRGRSLARAATLLGWFGALATPAAAQSRPMEEALQDARVREALAHLDDAVPATAALLAELGAIPSPSGEEHRRAEAVAARMRSIGLRDVEVDDGPNVIGRIPGRSGRALVFVSTLDDLATVAEHQRSAPGPPRVERDRVVGPGTNTSATTAAMLAAAEALVAAGYRPDHDLVFASVAQEETGLVGMRKLYERFRDRAVAFVDILGDGRSISYGALGIHWYRVVGHGPAGHSLNGGLPNVNRGIARAVDQILGLPHPERYRDRRTVVNVAVLNSGRVFNHKPETGWFSLDLRSLDAAVLAEMEQEVRAILEEVGRETETRLEMEPFSLTPGGQIPGARDSELVRASVAIARHLGLGEPQLSDAGSSNLNIAIAGGTPAIGLGGERGGGRGTPDEWADVPAMMRTARHVLLLAATQGGAAAPDF